MFDNLILTNEGKALLIEMLNGHNIKFTKIKMGDGNKPTNIKSIKNLVSEKQSLSIARIGRIDSETITIGANLMGKDVKEGFNWKEIGIFAKDLTTKKEEILFSYAYCTNSSYISKGGTVEEMLIDLNMKLGNSANVDIKIDSSLIFLTQKDLDEHKSETDSQIDDLTNEMEDKIGEVITDLNYHIKNKNNPHTVTKSQIGLGSVENYGIATFSDAQAGTSNYKYMTPAKVLTEIEAKSIITTGNVNLVISSTKPQTVRGKTIIWINTGND